MFRRCVPCVGWTCALLLVLVAHALAVRIVPTAAPPNPPSVGAFDSGVYRNVFVEGGIATAAEVQERVDELWSAFVAHRFVEFNSSLAFIQAETDMGVKTEGQSYGMLLCVQTDHQRMFDQLWSFAMAFMYYPTGNLAGYFEWLVHDDGSRIPYQSDAAPDGETYFAMALLMADARWGSDADPASIFNYKRQANELLHRMLHGNAHNLTMIDASAQQVKFVVGSLFTDPSYHVPHFYDYWSRYVTYEEDRATWAAIAAKSRSMWLQFAHPTSGLAPAYAYFNGTAYGASGSYGNHYSEDAWRVISNAALDYAWFAAADSEIVFANRMARFLDSKLSAGVPAVGAYYGELNLDGSDWPDSGGSNHSFEDPAAYALHGVLALGANASSGVTAWRSLQRFWDTPIPDTYYQQLCYHLSFLHCSGRFKIFVPPPQQQSDSVAVPPKTKAPHHKSARGAAGKRGEDGASRRSDRAAHHAHRP